MVNTFFLNTYYKHIVNHKAWQNIFISNFTEKTCSKDEKIFSKKKEIGHFLNEAPAQRRLIILRQTHHL